MDILYLLVGLAVLILSGEVLVRGAVAAALRMKVSTLVIGLTIVSLGTSIPELLISMKAALSEHPDISIGNVVGSNISNLGLVLGLTALIFPIAVEKDSLRIDWPIMMGASGLFYLFIQDGWLERWEGIVLFLFLVAFLLFIGWRSRKQRKEKELLDEEHVVSFSLLKSSGLMLVGCVGLVFGSDWLLKGAVGLARDFGVEEHVVAVTLVAFGTSVPELFTSVIAAIRKETGISVGNLIGSNIFNLLAILGLTSAVHPLAVSDRVITEDVFWMLGISFLIFPLMLLFRRLSLWDGLVLLASYVAYVYFIVAAV